MIVLEIPSPALLLSRVRELRPLVHHITNAVTVNDCANITLAVGGAPVMADAPEEVAEMVSMAHALVLNIGTLSSGQVEAMLLAGEAANASRVPIVLDPVGAGATAFRTATSLRLLDALEIAVLKGNAGEIGTIAGIEACTRGVDSGGIAGDPPGVARALARERGCIVAMSGPVDIVSDGDRVVFVENGHPLMGAVSGTGCMASSVAASFAAATADQFSAAAVALATFGLAGEYAAERTTGPGSFHFGLFDALAGMGPDALERGARFRFM